MSLLKVLFNPFSTDGIQDRLDGDTLTRKEIDLVLTFAGSKCANRAVLGHILLNIKPDVCNKIYNDYQMILQEIIDQRLPL